MQNSTLKKDLAAAVELFPKLRFNEVERTLEGEIDIFDALGNYVDSFDIRVIVPKAYPHRIPSLFETGGKLDHIADRHFNIDESCCVCSLQEADIRSQRGITITSFMEKYAVPFLANQLYFENKKEWANGEYAHGVPGIFQYYSEVLEIEDFNEVLRILNIFNLRKFHKNEECFCGSENKLKHCHKNAYRTIRDISHARYTEDLKLLNDLKLALDSIKD